MSNYNSDLLVLSQQESIDKQDIAIGVFPKSGIDTTTVDSVVGTNQRAEPVSVQLADTNQSIPVIYGIRSVQPILVKAALDSTGLKLILSYVVCEGEINGFFRLRLDGQYHNFGSTLNNAVATAITGPYANYVRAEISTGTTAGRASTLASPSTLYEGLCMLFLELTRTSTGYPFKDVPQVDIEVFGRKVLDVANIGNPRAYSTNPADIIYDYLTNGYFGKGLATTQIDIASFQTAKSKYNELIAPFSGQPTTTSYMVMNMVIDTANTVRENIERMLGSCISRLVYANGKYYLVVMDAGDTTALGTTAQVQAQFDTNTVFSDVVVQYGGKETRFNSVIARYDDVDASFLERQVNFPTDATNSFLVEDKNEPLVEEIYLHAVTDPYRARNIAQHILRKSRRSAKVTFTASKEAWKLLPGDIIDITWDLPAFTNSLLRIISMTWQDGLVQIEAETHQTSSYMPFALQRRVAPPLQPLLPGQRLVGDSGIIRPDTPFGLSPPTTAPSPGDPGSPTVPGLPSPIGPDTKDPSNVIDVGAITPIVGTAGRLAFGDWYATNNANTTTTVWARYDPPTNSANANMPLHGQGYGGSMIEGYGPSPTRLASPGLVSNYSGSTPIKCWQFNVHISSLNNLYFVPGRYIGVQWKLASEAANRFRSSSIGIRRGGSQVTVANYYWDITGASTTTTLETFLGNGYGLSLISTEQNASGVGIGYHQYSEVSKRTYYYYDALGLLQTARLDWATVPLPYFEQCEYNYVKDYLGLRLPGTVAEEVLFRKPFMPVFSRDAKASGLTLRFYTFDATATGSLYNVRPLGASSYNFTWDRATTYTDSNPGLVKARQFWARLYPADALLWTTKS